MAETGVGENECERDDEVIPLIQWGQHQSHGGDD